MTVASIGYAGGTDSNGAVRPAGGFDSMLYLYDAGVLIAQSDDGTDSAVDPATGLSADAAFTINVPAGVYLLALTQHDNFPLGDLSAGFSRAGAGNFTPTLVPTCSASSFCDISGASRTGNWVLTFSGVTAVPEPGAAALLLSGLAVVAALRRRRRG